MINNPPMFKLTIKGKQSKEVTDWLALTTSIISNEMAVPWLSEDKAAVKLKELMDGYPNETLNLPTV